MEIQHRPGSKHGNADSLSRYPLCPGSRVGCPSCRPPELAISSEPVISLDSVIPLELVDCPSESDSQDFCQSVEILPVIQEAGDGDPEIPGNRQGGILSNWLNTWGPEQLKAWQNEDCVIGKFLALKTEHLNKPPKSEVPTYPTELRKLYSKWEILKPD